MFKDSSQMKSGNVNEILICWVFWCNFSYMIFTGHRYIVKRKKKQGYAIYYSALYRSVYCMAQEISNKRVVHMFQDGFIAS